jgi:DNA modification methylase
MESTKTAITCLGKSFDNEDERREYFREELRKKLPELKKIDGFPIGDDEDIVNLSDPPYYTACPNPWLTDIIEEWENEKVKIKSRQKDFYVNEPYASDVSEGKNNPIYNAHSYHTKVPHPAIMRYILHYTQPGDIVLDNFAGTGMTGVAAQLCGTPNYETKIKINKEFSDHDLPTPNWGSRKSICGDLSPIASFISSVYNSQVNVEQFQKEAVGVMNELEKEFGWLYETRHTDKKKGKVNYYVWSEIFLCPNCTKEIVLWDVAINQETLSFKDDYHCNHCKVLLSKRTLEKATATEFDHVLNKTYKTVKSLPVLVNYTCEGRRYEKKPDAFDFEIITKANSYNDLSWFPKDLMLGKGTKWGDTWREGVHNCVTQVDHFYTKRTLIILSKLWERLKNNNLIALRLLFTASILNLDKRYKFREDRKGGIVTGTLYLPSLFQENSVFSSIKTKASFISSAFSITENINRDNITQVSDASKILVPENSIDYIFTDPPFGANIMYSELNFIWEAWLGIKTNNTKEAIESPAQGKSTLSYQELMTECFIEYYRVLKPGKWMTVEFSNTNAAVWNGIQTALQRAGFIIANVAALDKQQGSFKAVTTVTAVKQDLVISCYKPSDKFIKDFKVRSVEIGVWEFIKEHLLHLPIHLKKENSTTAIIERSPKILFDKVVKFYFLYGFQIPLDAKDFQEGLKQKFVERDGMYFTSEQAIEYDEKKAKNPKFIQLTLLVSTENEGIEWLRQELRRPQTYQDLHPKWMQAITTVRKGDILPELRDILNENFIQQVDGKWRVPDLNEIRDRDLIRNKKLITEFENYVRLINQPKAKKLKEVRVESLHAGFKSSWEKKDFSTIVKVGDMIPQNILLEDEQLLLYYDIAKDRL